MNFGRAVKALRSQYGQSQKELARKLGVSHTYISRIESGQRTPSIDFAAAVSESMSIPLPLFFLMAAEETELQGISSMEARELALTLFKLIQEDDIPGCNEFENV